MLGHQGYFYMLVAIIDIFEFLAMYLGWLSFVVVGICWYLIKKRYYIKCNIAIVVLSVFFIWAHYIERYIILVKEDTITGLGFSADVVLVSDIHLGLYKDASYLQRVVDEVNALSADYVVIAGDYLYKSEGHFEQMFRPFSRLNKPAYTIRGNHDYRYVRTQTSKELFAVLDDYGIELIEQKIVDMGTYQLAGLGDRIEGSDDAHFLQAAKSDKPLFILAHNPDSVDGVVDYRTAILMAGHTHCGQVRIPWIDDLVIRTKYGLNCGLGYFKEVPVFVTPGLGETNLPLRLFNPPTINLLHLRP